MLRLKQLSLTFTALNNAMTKLKESVADNNTIKSGQNYTDATPANKQAYDNAVNAAKGVIGETNNPTMDVNTVNQKAASVKSTKDALDGQQNLQRAKTEATNAITHASDLNQAQKNALTQQVNNTQNVQAVNDIKQTTQSLNTAMTGLKRGVANHNQVVQSDNYVNADTNKKNDYNNAYNHANDIINGNAQHPVITPSDVNNALSNVTSKEHALNGEAKLNTAKQEANTALGQLNNLNNAQRQNLQSQINGAHQIETVNAIKQNATNLNSAMGNLKHAVADKDQVKRTEDYADADTAKQNAYNSAVSSAETIINQTANSTMSVDDVNRATSAVTTNKNALNGDEKLAQSKTDAARAIDALPHLNNAQKADVKSKINAASNIAGVNTVKQQGTDLNTAMGNLQGAINDEQTTLNSQNYQDATPSKKTAYTNAVQAAKDILNKSNGQNKTKDQVTEAMNQVNSAKTNLDGTRLLDQAKQTAKQQLNNMTHLTTAQKTNLTNQINSGTTVAGVHTVQSNANTLDQAMNTLRQSIANKDATKASEDYVDANNDKQTAYNNAVAAAETIINANSNPEMNPSTITQKANQVNSSKTALNGDENLAAAKQNAKTYLNTLTSITDAQMNNLISQISSATRVSGVDTVKQNAQHLDQAMANLQNGINNESQVKSFEKYRDADTNKQQEYDNAITAAKAILNKQHGPNTAQNDVEAALQRVNTAKNALNGDAKLIAAQNAAKQHLGTLTHITTAQRNDLTNQISQATNLAGVETVKQSANSLDGAMGNLQTAINDKSGTLASQNFLDADEQKRNAYNQAVSAAETILNKQTGPNTAKTAVEQALNNLNTAKHALNGTQNLNNAKQAAITAINGASDLNQKQKDALKAQANGAQRVSNAQDVQRNATELNTAMGTLKHAIADKTNMLASSKYVNADSTKQNAYTTKVTNAEHIISGTPTVVTTPSEVTAAANQVNSAKQELNGDERLRVAKQNANTAIDALTQLNTPQKAKLNEQVGQANRLEDVQTVQTNGQSLNNAMKGLRDIIANETTVKASQNYTDASPNNQSTYNNAVSNAKGIINQTNNPTMDASAITQAATQVNNAKNGLNGAENLRNAQNTAKQNLNTLSHLTNNQKSAISSQIDRAGHVSEVTAAKNAATELNTQMGNLEQAIHDQNTVKQGANFTDADKAKCDAYTNAVSRAETILNKTQGENTSKQDVEAAIQNVTSAKNALNGDQNVTNAKNTAKHALNNLTSINNAQKRDVTTKIDQATTVAGVEAVSNTGTQLNTAMANLQNGINDKANTLASENYHDADSDKKTAYTQAVTNAENILNKNSGSNLDKAAVENALSQVTNAKGALNGNHNLEQAKSNANTTINGLQHLITAQKDKLKQQVQQAQNVAGVDTVKSSANTLNGAMGTLRNSIQDNTATKNGQNYLDATESNKTNYNNAVDSANSVINATSNPNMDANAINGMANQVNTTKAALNGAQNLAQAKTTAKNNLNNLTSINNAQKDALTRSIDGATTVAGVNQETAKATELNNAMHSLQNGINDETQTKQTQKYLDAEPSKKSAYDQAVNAAKAILTKASGQNVDKAAVEQALQNVNSTKTALNGDAKLNEAKAAAKQTLGTLTHINNAQRTALDNEITQATNVEGVNTVKVKAQQLDGAMGQLETSIRDKDTTLQSQNYQDAADAKRTAYSQAVNAAATILNKTVGGNTPKADVERAMQAVTQANTALNGIQNLERAKQAANTAITNASDLNTKQKEALKAQVTSAGRVSAANGVEHTATELNTAMTALKRAIADKADTKASGNYVNADANKRQAYDEKVTAAENIVSGTPTPTLTPSDVTNAATQVTNAKTQLNGNHNLEVAKQNANTAIDGLTPLNGPQKAKLKEQVGQATTLPNVQNVRDNAQTLNTAMKGLRDSIANEATIKAGQNYTDASQNKQTDYNNAVTAAKAIIGQTTSPTMNAQEINQAKDQVTAKQQALNGQENLRTAQTNAKQHLNGLSDLTNAQKDAAKRQIEGATYVNEVTQAQNNADALNTAMTNLKNGIQDQNTIKQGVNFTDADEAKRNAYTNAVTQAEQILNKAQGPNTAKDGVETALQNVQRAKNELNGNQNVANAKTTAKNALNNLTSINNAQKEAFKTQIEGATTVAGVNQVSTTASELNTAMSNLQNGINDEAATKAAQKYTDADRDKQTAYNDAVTAAKTLLDKTAGTNDNKAAVEQALQRVNTAKTALNGDARLNEAKNTAKQQSATMSHLTDAQKENLTEQIERGTTVAGVQDIQANAGTLNQAMNQLRQSIASKDATKSSEDYQDANADLQNAYNRAVSDAEDIISATNNPEMNPDTINQKASQVNSAKSALNGDEKLAAAKQTAKSDIGRLTDLNNAQRTAANAEVDQAPNLAAVTAAKNKATSLNTVMGNLKHALAEKDNTKRSVNYTDADRPKQQAYDTAVTQAEAITNANGSNANETQVQAALNQLNQAKNDLNGDNKVAQAKESAKRALASYSNLNNAQSTAATSQIDNATTVAGVTAAQNTANELNTAMAQLQNGINDQNTVKQQVNFTDADQGKKDAYTNAVTNAQGILEKAHGQNMTKAQVEAALNQLTTAKNALNGDANARQAKSDAKANLGTLTHLNNAQKQDLTSQIEGATTVNGVNGVKTKAQDLDGAMQRLESAIANKDQTKASENYIDADPTKKTAFDNAITQAESYLNKDHGANKDKQAVEQAIQSVTTAKNALNGDANLQRAKTEATQAIDNLTHLNTAQKTALKQQVNAAQRVSGVTDLKNSATSLNNAMDQLKQAIADHDTIVAGGNYTNASPDKQGAYTDAYNAAKNIVNGSPNVITNAADVTAATQRVNNAETGLNGDTNLATAKQQAKEALRQMTHLSDAQKQSITGQIDNATLVTGVQSVKYNATNLDNAMNQLRNSIANKDAVKASQPYVDADTDKQNAYNIAVTSAENIINAQKQDLNTQVTNAPNISTVNQVKTKAEQLDKAMERLINGIQDKDQVKQSVNFTDADPEKQTAYNNAVTAAENIINQANGTNANQSQVEAALSTVTTTKQALNGDRKVTDAKNNANQTLSTLDNLNNAQKGAVTGNINQAHTVAEVTQAIQTAQELNTAMGNLKNSLNDKDTTLGSQNFADADPEKKNAYNEAVRNVENILNKSTGTNVPKDQVEAAMNQVNTTKAALNGTQNLEKAKQHTNTAIDGLSHLTNAQKDALKQLVQQSTTVAEAQGNEQKANNVDAAMDKLRQSIADNATTKQNQNYTDASPNKKDAYNNAVTTAQGIIDETTSPTLDPTVINQAAGQVSTTKNALNGNENLEAAKQQATQSLGSLDNLNNAQKQGVTNQINGAHTVDEANQSKQNAQNLNTAMGNLKQEIADKDATKATVNFTDADQAKQQAYNTAVTNAENIISKANGSNASQTEVEQAMQRVNEAKQALNGNDNVQRAKDAANQAQQIANGTPTPVLTPDTVTQAVTTMNQAKDALNGDEKLAQAKQDALANLDTLRDLNQPQHDALRNQINQAQALATVEQTKQNAQNVNTAMGNLKQGIANKDTVKASENYHVADADKQTAYTNAVSQAEGIINQTTNPTLNPDEITRALTQVTDAKNGLNGEAKLATEKQNAKDAVNAMTHLNDAQKQALKGQIDQSPEIATVNQVKQTATSLDQAMNQLSQAINDKTQTLAEGNYLNADPDKQNAYKQAVAKAEALLNKQSGTNEVQAQVQSITNEVNTAKQALNGNDNLANAKQQAKQQLANLTHLNDAQKQSFESQITQAPLVTDVTTINQKAQALDHAMELLRNSIADNQATLASEDYHDATAQRQNDYNQAVTAAKNIINQTTSPTMNPDDINRATTQVNNTKVALDGDENLAAAKQQANNRLNQLDHLNNAQKQQLQSQITQSSDIAAVNGHKQTAESLNTAMSNLINAIADHQAVEQRGNFINADTDKQTAYTTAVNEAEAMINKQTGQNANQTEVEQAITKVQTTLQALNGDHNLQVAKTNATQAIDALTSLNDPQKTALKDQVTAATLVTAVHQIEQNANTLNQAMYGLRESIQDNAATKANSKYINEDQPEQQNYDQAVQAANSIINEQTATLDNNAIKQAATTVNTTKAALHGDVKLQNDKDHAKQTVSQLAHLNNAQKHMEDTLIDSETTRTAVKQDLTEAQALDQLMNTLQQSIADKDATRASGAYVNAEPNKKQAYDEAVQNAESIIAGLNNPTINKGNVSSATQAVTTSKNGLDGVERLAQDKQTAGNSLNHLDQLTPAQQQALENQINNATTRDKVAEIIAQAQALNEAMKALKESIKDQRQTEASSKFINEDQAQKDAYTQAVQHAKDLINKTTDPTLVKSVIDQATQAVNDAKNNLHGDQKLAQDKQRATEMLNNLNTPQRQALENQINNAGTRGEVAQKLTKAQALNQAMEALRNSIQDQQQTESGSKFINEDKPQKDGYQAAVQHAKDLINQTSNPTLDKAQVEQLTQGVNQAKDNLHGDQKLARDQQQAVTTVNALPNLNHAQQQALTDAINTAPTRTEVAQHVQTATELDHAMETLKNKVDQVNTDKAQPNYTEASTDKKEAVDQALQAAESITDPTNGSNANKDAVEQALTKIQEKVNELNGNERVAEAKAQAKQTIGQLTHLNADQIATAKQNIDQATKLQLIAELVDQATQLNQSMDQLQQAVNEHANVEQTVDYTQADSDKQNAYKQAIAAENVLKQNSNKQQVDQALQNILNAQQALNGDERVALAKTNGKHDIDQLNALNNAQQDGFKGRIDQSNDLNQIQQIVDEAKALNRAMDQLSQEITGNEGRTKGSTNYVNADTQVKQVYDETVDKAKQALDKSTGQNLTAEQVIKLNDAVTAAKKALNGEERLNNRKSEALQRLDQLTHLNNAQRQLAIQQINNAETLNKASRAINRATKLDNAMGAVQQYIDEQHLGDISSTNYINADDNLKANYDNAIANAAHELDKVQGNTIAKAEAEQLKQNIIDAQNALNGDQNLANAKDKANAFVNSLNGLNQQQQDLAHKAINNADTVSDVTDIVNNQIDLNDAMETLKHSVDNEIPKAEQTVNYQNADDNAKTNFDDAKRLANTLLNSDNTNVNDINGAIQAVNDAIQNLNGDQRLQDAKDKAIQSINQALANKLKEIEASNATEQDKLIAKNKAEELANNIIANINKATSNQAVTQIQTAGNQAIEQMHANEIPKAKIDANKDVDKRVQALIDEIDQNPNLTDKEKQALKDRINQILQQGHNDINNALTKEAIEQAKERLAQALQDIKDLVKAKEDAKNKIKALANAKRDQINSNPDLTPEQKAKALKEIDEAEKRALQNVENAQTIDQLNRGLNLGLDDIRNTHVWEVDDQPAVNEISEATPEQLLVNGELIVHRDDIITEQDVLAHINLIDQLTAEVIDTPSTATISDSLIAKVEVTLLDGSKVIVNVPVKVVEKELSVVKQQAIESIENAAQQKINEINNSVTLTLEQKEAAIAEVNKLKQQAIDHINNAPDVHSVEEIQQQEQAHIEQFNPEQFTIEQAKSNAIKSIEDAIQHMIDEIKARTDLTDKEKQEAIAKLNQLKEQAIQAIQRAQSIDEITEQLEQFKAQMKAANPIAKELAKRKQEAISRIKDFSNEKMNSIRNSEIGSADEKQAAMNRINEIVLETIRDINNAHTLQQVEAALNNGIARISAVQIVTSDRAKQSSSTGNESNSHLTIGYGTANHPFNSSTIGHKQKLDEDDDIDPLHMRHFSNNFGNVIKNAIGVVGISGLLASFWFFIAKRRRKEDEEEELEIRDNNKDSIKETLDDTKHLPLLFAKRRRKEDEEDVTVAEKDSLNNGESLDKVKHTPFFLPKRRRKEDEEDVEVTNENTDEEVLKDNEHSPLLIAKRRKDKEEDVETTTSIESKDEDVPLLLAKKKNQKDNQSEDKKSASKNTSKKVAAKKKKKKSKKNKK